MGVMNGWSVCDRCGFDYRRKHLRKETTGLVVCYSCYDGAYDLRNHPQNRPFRPRRELLPIPDGRPMQVPPILYLLTEDRQPIKTETGRPFLIPDLPPWTPNQSTYIL